MIKIKHFTDAVEDDDGQRLWVEPIGLTLDLREMCAVDHVLPHLGPPRSLWDWYEKQGPDAYEYFRARYHEVLARSPYKQALKDLADAASGENFTLLHQGDDPAHNTGTAMYEFLTELQAFTPPSDE
jgi:uncharacterized protein YeaO (DUF488 family)